MRTIEIKLFTFDELSQEAQIKAVENHNQINVDHEWCACSIDHFKTESKAAKLFDIDKVYFSGFCSQGDGAMFEYDGISEVLFFEAIDGLKLPEWKKAAMKKAGQFYAKGKQYGRYSHEKSCIHTHEFTVNDGKLENIGALFYDQHDAIEQHIIFRYENFCHELYKDLESEYNYLTSFEAIKETLIGNGYEFTEDGTIY